jgi:hypothetical protein
MGKPVGHGGPWKNTDVKSGVASDPYLIGFYDDRSLKLSHTAKQAVVFKIEVDPVGTGQWMKYKEVTVAPGGMFIHHFPAGVQARWIRFSSNSDCKATALLEYK